MSKIMENTNHQVAVGYMVTQLSTEAHENALAHGFYDDHRELMYFGGMENVMPARRDFILAQLAKIGSEVGEAVSVIQHGENNHKLGEELADVIIRVLDLAGFLKIDIGEEIIAKMLKNKDRPYLHGKKC